MPSYPEHVLAATAAIEGLLHLEDPRTLRPAYRGKRRAALIAMQARLERFESEPIACPMALVDAALKEEG